MIMLLLFGFMFFFEEEVKVLIICIWVLLVREFMILINFWLVKIVVVKFGLFVYDLSLLFFWLLL